MTEHSYEDTRLMVQASKQNLPSSVGLIEYEKISTKLRYVREHTQSRWAKLIFYPKIILGSIIEWNACRHFATYCFNWLCIHLAIKFRLLSANQE